MRLTLRTLLAWLDDKLSPTEVREIGKQVAESPYAKELVDRIHKVTRQRRLSVPSSTGPDATDPSLVASYIDNELDPDQVSEFEKKCLTSDVHLAEVSSVHQILSLIGQKAKVPNGARLRMHQLVKGREALQPVKGNPEADDEETSVAQPIQPWVTPPAPYRPLLQRFGPIAAVLGLITVLAWSAWSTLSNPEPHPTARNLALATPKAGASKKPAESPAPAPEATPTPVPAPATLELATPDTTATAPVIEPTAKEGAKEAAKPAAAGAEIPAGAVAFVKKPEGVLLRYNPAINPDHREWVRITEPTPLREQDRLLSLDPFRSTLEVGSANVDLVAETELWMRTTPKTQAARLTLARGRVVLHGTPSGLPFEVQSGSTAVTITPPPGVNVGVERVFRRSPGEATASASLLNVYAVDGPVKVESGRESMTLGTAGTVTIGPDGKPGEPSTKPAPSWVTETSPSPFDQKIGEQFLQFFRPELLAGLAEATESEQKDVCRLAISALKAVGDISLIVPILKTKDGPAAPTARRAAISVLRAYLAEGEEAGKALREQLKRDLGDEQAVVTEKLLVGYNGKEAKEEATYAFLVDLLGSTSDTELGVRELALDVLRQLTGRDEMGYDPAKPEGSGLTAWRDLLRAHELKPPPTQPEVR